MTTQELYQKVLKNQATKNDFLWEVRRDLRFQGILSNNMSYEDTIKVLKAKGFINESEEINHFRPFDFSKAFQSINEGAKNKLKGGKGDKLTPDQVNYYEFQKGWKHELEHTDDIDKAKEIALDHLAEDPNYYTRLDMIEFKANKKNRTDLPIDISKKNSPKKDEANQMEPSSKEKDKSNVDSSQGKKEKARSKTAGVKKMKGGSGEMKSLREAAFEKEEEYWVEALPKSELASRMKTDKKVLKLTDKALKAIQDKFKEDIISIKKASEVPHLRKQDTSKKVGELFPVQIELPSGGKKIDANLSKEEIKNRLEKGSKVFFGGEEVTMDTVDSLEKNKEKSVDTFDADKLVKGIQAKKDSEPKAQDAGSRKVFTKIPGAKGRPDEVPYNRGVKVAIPQEGEFEKYFMVYDKDDNKIYLFDKSEKERADKMLANSQKYAQVKRHAQAKGLQARGADVVKINEAEGEDSSNSLVGKQITLQIKSDSGVNNMENVTDTVASVSKEGDSVIIRMETGGEAIFSKNKPMNDDPTPGQILNTPKEIDSALGGGMYGVYNKAKNEDTVLEKYIRKRIKEALENVQVTTKIKEDMKEMIQQFNDSDISGKNAIIKDLESKIRSNYYPKSIYPDRVLNIMRDHINKNK